MKIVGAAFGDNVHYAAQHGAKFGAVGMRDDLEFLYGINDGRDGIGALDGAVVIQSVHQVHVAAICLPVDGRKAVVCADSDRSAKSAAVLHAGSLPGHDRRRRPESVGEAG